ncbi:MAG TPA: hypothetical protein VFV99_14475 [Kofleriaceae bacterium]|nr:hypothetical protein [Kofleriaceae bacterium]
MLRGAAIVCLLAGCDVVWRLDDVHGEVAVDARSDAPGSCAFVDDFTGTMRKQQWDVIIDDPRIMIAQANMTIIDAAANIDTNAETYLRLIERQTLAVGDHVDVEIPQATNTDNGQVETSLLVGQNPQNGYVIDVSQTFLEFYSRVASVGTLASTRMYEPAAHRWWRLTHGPGELDVTFYTSVDGHDWFGQKTVTMATPLVDVEVVLLVGSYNGGASLPTRAIFDNFSICGP